MPTVLEMVELKSVYAWFNMENTFVCFTLARFNSYIIAIEHGFCVTLIGPVETSMDGRTCFNAS